MPVYLTDETFLHTGVVDSASTPLLDDFSHSNTVFKGYDGLYYTARPNASNSVSFYTVDHEEGTRTLAFTKTTADVESDVIANSFPSFDTGAYFSFSGRGNVENGYYLFAAIALSGPQCGTVWALYRVDGGLSYVGAIQFLHASNVRYMMYTVGTVSIANAKTVDDPIIVAYNGTGTSSAMDFRAWRLPSINQFTTLDGTQYSSTVTNYNNIDISGAWDEQFGAHLTQSLESGGSYRDFSRAYWLLPYTGGSGTANRLHYYVGRAEVQWHLNNPASSRTSDFVLNYDDTYPGGWVGYINLGSDLAFSTGAAWSVDTTRVIDNTLLVSDDGNSEVIPVNLYHANGTTLDEYGYGDYGGGPSYRKMTSGTLIGKYLVTFGATLQNDLFDQYSDYSGAATHIISRWMGFVYDEETGIHRLVTKGSFISGDRDTDLNVNSGSSIHDDHKPYYISLDYDEATKSYVYTMDSRFSTGGEDYDDLSLFGRLDLVIDFSYGSPCFLEETDTTYYDFVARYPDG